MLIPADFDYEGATEFLQDRPDFFEGGMARMKRLSPAGERRVLNRIRAGVPLTLVISPAQWGV